MSKEEIIELMIQASKWGSWAYDLKERDRQGKINIEDFKKWRRDIMEDIYNTNRGLLNLNLVSWEKMQSAYNDFLKQNKDKDE